MENDLEVRRHPIFISENSVIVVNIYEAKGWTLDTIWTMEYIDSHKEVEQAAKDLVNSIKDVCSIRMLWELRKALAKEIQNWNESFGTDHPVDDPEKE